MTPRRASKRLRRIATSEPSRAPSFETSPSFRYAQAFPSLETGERPGSAAVAAFGGDDPGGEGGGGDGAEDGADGKIDGGDVAPGELDQAVDRTVNEEKDDKGDSADDTPRHFVDDMDEQFPPAFGFGGLEARGVPAGRLGVAGRGGARIRCRRHRGRGEIWRPWRRGTLVRQPG